MEIILDTNFLISSVNFKIDILPEIRRISNFNYTVHVLDGTIRELNKLTGEGKRKDRLAAKLSLMIIDKGIKVIHTKEEGHVDDQIVDMASKHPDEFIVATQDAELKKRLKEAGIKRMVIRQKKVYAYTP